MAVVDDVKGILRDTLLLGDEVAKLGNDSALLGGIKELDSMAVVTVLTAIEEKYDFVIDDDEISADVFETVGTLVSFVEEKLAAS